MAASEETRITSITDRNAKAVAKATADQKAASDADAERKSTQDRIKALEERTERKPVDLRRITKIFWGGGDD